MKLYAILSWSPSETNCYTINSNLDKVTMRPSNKIGSEWTQKGLDKRSSIRYDTESIETRSIMVNLDEYEIPLDPCEAEELYILLHTMLKQRGMRLELFAKAGRKKLSVSD